MMTATAGTINAAGTRHPPRAHSRTGQSGYAVATGLQRSVGLVEFGCQPSSKPQSKRQPAEDVRPTSKQHQVGKEYRRKQRHGHPRREPPQHERTRDRSNQKGHRPLQERDLTPEAHATDEQRAHADHCREVEDVGADDDAQANVTRALDHSDDRRGKLRSVRGQRGEKPEQRLGHSEPYSELVQPASAELCRDDRRREGGQEQRNRYWCRHGSPFGSAAHQYRRRPELPGTPAVKLPESSPGPPFRARPSIATGSGRRHAPRTQRGAVQFSPKPTAHGLRRHDEERPSARHGLGGRYGGR